MDYGLSRRAGVEMLEKASRAQAVRWTLARIRERPAYAELRERAKEIETLKSRF